MFALRIRIRRVNSFFLTKLDWEHLGGLPGLSHFLLVILPIVFIHYQMFCVLFILIIVDII
jgi:hypothetical protein